MSDQIITKDGWIKHDGGPCPVDPETWVQVKSGITGAIHIHQYVEKAGNLYWPPVLEYRIFTPVTAPPDDDAFIRDTAARVLAGFAGRDRWDSAPADLLVDMAIAAAEALAAKLKERKA